MFQTRLLPLPAVVTVLVFTGSVRAATRYVQNISGCCVNTAQNCTGLSGTPPFCTIEDAVNDDNTIDGDIILVAPGTYQPPGFDLRITKNIALVSAGTDPPLQRALQTTIQKMVHFRPGDGPGRRHVAASRSLQWRGPSKKFDELIHANLPF